MRVKAALALAFLAFWPQLGPAAYRPRVVYSMADLEKLEEQKAYREFFAHAKDIAPGKREQAWQKMVNAMAEGWVQQAIEQKDFRSEQFQKIESLAAWPELKDHEFFHRSKSRYALTYTRRCLEGDERPALACLSRLLRLWRSAPSGPRWAIEYGLLTAEHLPQQQEMIWDFFPRATQSEYAKFYCRKKGFQEVALDHLYQWAAQAGSHKELQQKIQEHLNQDCWQELTPSVHETLKNPKDPLWSKALRLAQAMETLDQEQQDLYALLYYLQIPVPGDSLNLAWHQLKSLGDDEHRRRQVLQTLTAMDPLPGLLFSHSDKKRRQALLQRLHRHFPEYMDGYAQTCLQYLEGTRSFSQGNPTLHCHDLFQAASGTDWIPSGLQKRYQKVKL